MATVWLAVDLKHDRPVAIKVLNPELAAALGGQRFLTEIRTVANLEHPHILPLFDSGEDDGLLWYAMPFIEGESLQERLDREGPLPVQVAVGIANRVAGALQAAHDQGIVHRDIKPANILLDRRGEPRVADFGVALALSAARSERLTATGLSVGTPSYMSPEQLTGDADVDARSDVYALGMLAYEMLTGRTPFEGGSLASVMTRVLTQAPQPVRDIRPEVPIWVAAAVERALAREPDERFPSAAAFAKALVAGAEARPAGSLSVRLVGVAALLVAGGAGYFAWTTAQRSAARESLGAIEALVDEGWYAEAYDRALEARRWLPSDPALAELVDRSSFRVSVVTSPPGAVVELQRFGLPGGEMPEAEQVGSTPLQELRLPRADHRLVLSLPGHVPRETVVSSELAQEFFLFSGLNRYPVEVELVREEDQPPGMVFVPGGEYRLSSPDAPSANDAVTLEPFFIDRFEVTNEAYAEFVREGGYSREALWSDAPAAIRETLVDRTGLPGPRGWSRQRFPEARERFPVTGVTWWEARAFCRAAGGRLPTVFEWEKTARSGLQSTAGVIMPWGLESAATGGGRRANFRSEGPVPVDAYPFGVSFYGAYGMAGNVREWTANAFGEGRAVTGGSWDGPAYLYTEYADVDPAYASEALGFRCALHEGPGDQGALGIELDLTPPIYTPVDRAAYEALLDFYRYDPVAPNPRVDAVDETPDWTRSRIWIDGPAGDSVLLYFWAPRSTPPPYQTLAFVPGSSVFFLETLPDDVENTVGPLIQGGRAVLGVVMTGMLERAWPPGYQSPAPPSVGFRDLMVRHGTELRLAIDYVQGREDVDMDRFAYVATSWGAGSRLPFAVVDDRYRAVVLIGAGIDERVKPTLPEADNVNFAPYIDVPTLMVNGTNDEEHPWLFRAKPLWDLLSEPKELVLVEGAGHMPPVEDRIPAINGFLDRVLGPVRR